MSEPCPLCRATTGLPTSERRCAWLNLHVPLDLLPGMAVLMSAVRDGQPLAATEAFLPLLRAANERAAGK